MGGGSNEANGGLKQQMENPLSTLLFFDALPLILVHLLRVIIVRVLVKAVHLTSCMAVRI